MKTMLFISFALVVLGGCSSTGSYTRADRHKRFVEVQSSSDTRSAMVSPSRQSSVKDTIGDLKERTQRNPRDIAAWLNLSRLYVAGGKLSEADAAAKKVLRLDIKNREAKKVLAQVALKNGRYELAKVILNGLGGDRSKDSQILNLLAQAALHTAEPSLAMQRFKKALELDPSNISVRMNLGVAYLKYRQLNAAATQFQRVLKVMPEHTDAILHLAIVKSAWGQLDEAESMYETVLSRKKNNPIALFNLAVVKRRQEDYDGALKDLKTYLKTAEGRSNQTEEVFALIDEIKTEQAKAGESTVSDDEIQLLAEELEDRDQGNRKGAVASNHVAESVEDTYGEAVPEDNEIESLERALIE